MIPAPEPPWSGMPEVCVHSMARDDVDVYPPGQVRNFWDMIPLELLFEILEWLEDADLISCSGTCLRWREVSHQILTERTFVFSGFSRAQRQEQCQLKLKQRINSVRCKVRHVKIKCPSAMAVDPSVFAHCLEDIVNALLRPGNQRSQLHSFELKFPEFDETWKQFEWKRSTMIFCIGDFLKKRHGLRSIVLHLDFLPQSYASFIITDLTKSPSLYQLEVLDIMQCFGGLEYCLQIRNLLECVIEQCEQLREIRLNYMFLNNHRMGYSFRNWSKRLQMLVVYFREPIDRDISIIDPSFWTEMRQHFPHLKVAFDASGQFLDIRDYLNSQIPLVRFTVRLSGELLPTLPYQMWPTNHNQTCRKLADRDGLTPEGTTSSNSIITAIPNEGDFGEEFDYLEFEGITEDNGVDIFSNSASARRNGSNIGPVWSSLSKWFWRVKNRFFRIITCTTKALEAVSIEADNSLKHPQLSTQRIQKSAQNEHSSCSNEKNYITPIKTRPGFNDPLVPVSPRIEETLPTDDAAFGNHEITSDQDESLYADDDDIEIEPMVDRGTSPRPMLQFTGQHIDANNPTSLIQIADRGQLAQSTAVETLGQRVGLLLQSLARYSSTLESVTILVDYHVVATSTPSRDSVINLLASCKRLKELSFSPKLMNQEALDAIRVAAESGLNVECIQILNN